MKKKNSKKSGKAESPARKEATVVTPAAIISACLGLGIFAVSVMGVANGKTGAYYLMGLSLLFFAAIGLGHIRK